MALTKIGLRNDTWIRQYVNFSSFEPVQYKRGVVWTLPNPDMNICIADSLQMKLEILKHSFMYNGYMIGFIKHQSNHPDQFAQKYLPLDWKLLYN